VSLKPTRKCLTCGHTKCRDLFPSTRAQRCQACRDAQVASRCESCGGPVPRGSGGFRRKFCDRPECKTAARRKAARAERRSQRKTTRQCPACLKTKPLTGEYWYPALRDDAGNVRRYDGLCKPCKRADQKMRYAESERRRELAGRRSRRQRDRIKARMEADADFAAQQRERERVWSAMGRARARGEQEEAARMRGQGGHLPAQPLVDAITREVRVRADAAAAADVCSDLGVDVRTLTAWRSGERVYVQLDKADAVIQALGVNWFDVYDEDVWPEAYAQAEAAFG
jgi:hypothetical protein